MFLISRWCFGHDEAKEPAQELTLLINGSPHPIVVDKELKMEGQFENPTIVLQASSTRTFPYAGINFKYPAGFSWEADIENEDSKNWTLTGNDTTIIYFVVKNDGEELTPETYASGFKKQLEGQTVTFKPLKETFGKSEISGQRISFEIGGIQLVQSVFAIQAKEGYSNLLVIQMPKDAASNEECQNVRKLFAETLSFPPMDQER
jgi:hypothetical protein